MSDRPADESERDNPQPQRRPLNFRTFESLVDKLLDKARSQGQFDNLEGQGKPIEQNPSEALIPEDMRTGFRMLKNAGFAPPWVEARRAIDDQRGALQIWLAQANTRWGRLDDAGRAKLRAEYRRRLEDLQREILTHNLTSPEAAGQIPGIQIAKELEKLGGG